ncbi:Hypothetical protein, putative [Bodo saltans]|uniref:Uncharacterized protein n=1 Tax=Bodo saltans TaxID=75058 RepID=A0A0S4IP29_BODSA|nr:Hypothetical protein, putative [Bodo saltans]|eukprot:CUE86147.1 Hypothetical protein, putative [Bodo saltans]
MSKFVDPRHASGRHVRPQAEIDLVEEAAAYANQQKNKSVRWFVSHGSELPTPAESSKVTARRNQAAARILQDERENDRQRDEVPHFGEVVIIPTTVHPLYSEEEQAAPPFVEAAANGLSGRANLFSAIEQLCRIVMLRNRCDTRLSILAKKAKADPAVMSSRSHLTLIEMPQLYSSDVAVGAPPSLNIPFSAPTVELYHAKELKTAFVFKNKSYKQLKFSEHSYANADLPVTVPVLFAGIHEVPPESNEAYSVPKIEHFVQPLVTLETFPSMPFAYVTPEPWRHTIQSQLPQRLSSGGFQERHQTFQFGRLAATRAFHSDPSTRNIVRAAIPLRIDALEHGDALSDSDDEDALEIDRPNGLDHVKQWVPSIETSRMPIPSSGPRHAVENESCRSRLEDLHNHEKQFISDLPLEFHLAL